MITDAQIDEAFERAMQRRMEQDDAARLRDCLETIDKLGRRGLLILLDYDSSKITSRRLWKRARLAAISGVINNFDVHRAYQIERAP